jgi:hypothetical protein
MRKAQRAQIKKASFPRFHPRFLPILHRRRAPPPVKVETCSLTTEYQQPRSTGASPVIEFKGGTGILPVCRVPATFERYSIRLNLSASDPPERRCTKLHQIAPFPANQIPIFTRKVTTCGEKSQLFNCASPGAMPSPAPSGPTCHHTRARAWACEVHPIPHIVPPQRVSCVAAVVGREAFGKNPS